ncbi:MAG: hypothetical protein ETSY1_25650 [Candidatus Entotheonella factor]|uniref:DUF7482 domain-containing protein n=2 Tax=Candidatus Entotheonella TaxID=93171 RepID=W4LH49_ENTF1|nr:MAG: hypothetical protein ETSY1_25650 [Candidatus Entotheonella factor]
MRLSLASIFVLVLSMMTPLHAQDLTPGCRIIPVDPDIGADIPLDYFGPAPSTVERSLVGPVQLLTAGEVDVVEETLTLPLYRGALEDGRSVWYILTDTTDRDNAEALGLNHSAKLNFAVTGNGARRGVIERVIINEETGDDDVMLVFNQGTVDFSPERQVQADTSDPEQAFPPQVAQPGSVGDAQYSPLVKIDNAGDHVYNAPMIAFDVSAEQINCPDGNCDYSLVHDAVLAINAPNDNPNESSVTLKLTPGFSFGRPVLYISTEASDPVVAALEGVTYTTALRDILVGNDDSAFSAVERLFTFLNGPLGCENPQRQGQNSGLVDDRGPFNVLGGIPTIATDYSPLWDVNIGEWTQESIDLGIRNRLRGEFDILLHVDSGFVTGPGGSEYGSSGIIVNCPIVARLL